MRLKLLFTLAFTAIFQIATTVATHAESSQIDRLVSQRNLASSLNISNNQTETNLIARSRRKSPPPANCQTPQPVTNSPNNAEKQVIVSEIVITADRDRLPPELESKIRQVLTIKTGQKTDRAQLEQNLNAVKALGDFATVEIVPEDTAKGVKISFLVKPYGMLDRVQVKTLPATSSSVLAAAIDRIFKPQYGKRLNSIELKAAIKQLNELYQQQGYNLAQVVDIEELTPDGKLILVIAEGQIEDVRVRFLNKQGEAVDEKKQPLTGQTRPFIITREAELKAGKIFNRTIVERDLRRIYGLGLFDDVRVSFAPGNDPAKVILQYDVIERGKNFSIVPNVGYGSVNGFFAMQKVL